MTKLSSDVLYNGAKHKKLSQQKSIKLKISAAHTNAKQNSRWQTYDSWIFHYIKLRPGTCDTVKIVPMLLHWIFWYTEESIPKSICRHSSQQTPPMSWIFRSAQIGFQHKMTSDWQRSSKCRHRYFKDKFIPLPVTSIQCLVSWQCHPYSISAYEWCSPGIYSFSHLPYS